MMTPEFKKKPPLIIIELVSGKRIWTDKTEESSDKKFILCEATTINGNPISYKIKKDNIALISTQSGNEPLEEAEE